MSVETQMVVREIINIDEALCDGCGLCVPACAEGALKIVNGKAKLVSDVYCDGMGVCLGHCPQDAIQIERRTAAEFDEAAVEARLAELTSQPSGAPIEQSPLELVPISCGCPSSLSRAIAPPEEQEHDESQTAVTPPSELRNWPVELKLAPLEAPYYDQAELLISADCVPFAHANFHRRFLRGRTLLIGCPKLDDAKFYQAKLTEIFKQNNLRSVEIAFMEVPCCLGLVSLIKQAITDSGKQLKATACRISTQGIELQSMHLDQFPF